MKINNTYSNPGASSASIQKHYDIQVDFWKLWLGSTMAYSCAAWEQAEELDCAQNDKLDFHINNVCTDEGTNVLDIGCGWGSILRKLADKKCNSIGLTLSPAQESYVESLKLPNTEVRVESWSEHTPSIQYDSIISIGAFEHFAKPDLDREEKIKGYKLFFERCHKWLIKGGKLSLQTITYGNMCPNNQSGFLKNEIYPESELPYLDEILESCRGYFQIESIKNDREDYLKTCRVWLNNLRLNKNEAKALVGEEVFKRYENYLRACIIGFYTDNADLMRLVLRRNETPYFGGIS